MKQVSRISWPIILVMVGTLGLAPFFPEPHVWGKIKWLIGGAQGMGLMDWVDLAMHGSPWLLLVVKAYVSMRKTAIQRIESDRSRQ